MVVTNEEHRFLAQEQLSEIELTDTTLLLEPVGGNTAPAITFAVLPYLGNDSPNGWRST